MPNGIMNGSHGGQTMLRAIVMSDKRLHEYFFGYLKNGVMGLENCRKGIAPVETGLNKGKDVHTSAQLNLLLR